VDWEGEAVDKASAAGGDDHDLRLLAAHWAIAYYQARTVLTRHGLGPPDEVVLRFQRQQVLLHRVTDDYLVVLSMGTEANLGRALRLLRQAGPRLRGAM
jgi:predicted regulator of Ras-like GTPase activity (Roadblock/LC7/MglB family)